MPVLDLGSDWGLVSLKKDLDLVLLPYMSDLSLGLATDRSSPSNSHPLLAIVPKWHDHMQDGYGTQTSQSSLIILKGIKGSVALQPHEWEDLRLFSLLKILKEPNYKHGQGILNAVLKKDG